MTFEDNSFRISTNHLLYIPANTEYIRQSYDDEEIIAIHFNILNKDFFAPFFIDVEEETCNNAFRDIYIEYGMKEKWVLNINALLSRMNISALLLLKKIIQKNMIN